MENSVGNVDPIRVFHNQQTSSLRKVGTPHAIESGSFGNPGLVPRTRNRERRFGGGTIRSLTSQTPRRSAAPQRARHPATAPAGAGRQVPIRPIKIKISILNEAGWYVAADLCPSTDTSVNGERNSFCRRVMASCQDSGDT